MTTSNLSIWITFTHPEAPFFCFMSIKHCGSLRLCLSHPLFAQIRNIGKSIICWCFCCNCYCKGSHFWPNVPFSLSLSLSYIHVCRIVDDKRTSRRMSRIGVPNDVADTHRYSCTHLTTYAGSFESLHASRICIQYTQCTLYSKL